MLMLTSTWSWRWMLSYSLCGEGVCASVLIARAPKSSPHPPLSFYSLRHVEGGRQLLVGWWQPVQRSGPLLQTWWHGGMGVVQMCNKVPCPSLPPSPTQHPSLIWSGWCKARGERSRAEPHLPSLALTVLWEPRDSCCPPAHPHTLALRARDSEWEREGGYREKKGRGEREGHWKKNPEERKHKDFLFPPKELRITLSKGWQKGERERRRFSSCER